jgi:hypothetical protein
MMTFEGTPLVFNDEDYAFIRREFGLDRKAVGDLDDNSLDDLYEKCCDIEVTETIAAGNNDLSERGKTAVRLVDLIHGIYDSTEFDKEMAEIQ